jgi:hypothetical protein
VGAGCTAIAALSLQNPANSKALCVAGAPEVILQGMKIHAEDSSVQVCYLLTLLYQGSHPIIINNFIKDSCHLIGLKVSSLMASVKPNSIFMKSIWSFTSAPMRHLGVLCRYRDRFTIIF